MICLFLDKEDSSTSGLSGSSLTSNGIGSSQRAQFRSRKPRLSSKRVIPEDADDGSDSNISGDERSLESFPRLNTLLALPKFGDTSPTKKWSILILQSVVYSLMFSGERWLKYKWRWELELPSISLFHLRMSGVAIFVNPNLHSVLQSNGYATCVQNPFLIYCHFSHFSTAHIKHFSSTVSVLWFGTWTNHLFKCQFNFYYCLRHIDNYVK